MIAVVVRIVAGIVVESVEVCSEAVVGVVYTLAIFSFSGDGYARSTSKSFQVFAQAGHLHVVMLCNQSMTS